MKHSFLIFSISLLLFSCAPGTQAVVINEQMAQLLPAAQKEGKLVLIGQPRDWCNYGELMDTFEQNFGVDVETYNADATSEQRIAAMSGDAKKTPPPDVIDVGFAFVESAKADGLLAPYKVSTWDDIPTQLKEPDGYWTGGYYAVMSFLVNTDIQPDLPTDWDDLLGEQYHGQVSFYGDPRSSNQAIQTVAAAALANGGDLEHVEPGLQFFAELNQQGNLNPIIANSLLVARGSTPVLLAWDQYARVMKNSFANNPHAELVIPEHGRIANVYVQALNANAEHPNAARLWLEFLYSDEGQQLWMQGYCHPVCEATLRAQNKLSQELLDEMPLIENVVFPSIAQLNKAKEIITGQWDSVVGVDIEPAP